MRIRSDQREEEKTFFFKELNLKQRNVSFFLYTSPSSIKTFQAPRFTPCAGAMLIYIAPRRRRGWAREEEEENRLPLPATARATGAP